jgi:hypothetical protein
MVGDLLVMHAHDIDCFEVDLAVGRNDAKERLALLRYFGGPPLSPHLRLWWCSLANLLEDAPPSSSRHVRVNIRA